MLYMILTTFGGFIGSIVTLGIQQYRLERSEDSILISEHIKDLERIADASLDYWLTTPSKEKDIINSVKLNTSVNIAARSFPDIIKTCGNYRKSYEELMLEMYQYATGGLFASISRDVDPEKAEGTIDCVNKIIVLLRKIRRNQSSIGLIIYKCNINKFLKLSNTYIYNIINIIKNKLK